MADVKLIVVGAGVIGLAVAREAALRGIRTMVLEAGDVVGGETSSRNSEVIHAGIYYSPGSLKAWHCVAGRKQLYGYLSQRAIPHRRCGKLIVATCDAEEEVLQHLRERAVANGLAEADRLQYLSRREVNRREPELRASAALLSPSTGIVDSHSFMLALQGDAEAAGAEFVFRTRVESLSPGNPHMLAGTSGGQPWELRAGAVIVASGHHSASLMQRDPRLSTLAPEIRLVKGNYFALPGKSPFKQLIYPVPARDGLGIHATLDLAGQTRFGPDTEPVTAIDYDVDPRRRDRFESSIRRYWPGLASGKLVPAYAGIRPKVVPGTTGTGESDFLIQGPEELGEQGLVILHGIESPGLTAALSLARAACDRLSQSIAN